MCLTAAEVVYSRGKYIDLFLDAMAGVLYTDMVIGYNNIILFHNNLIRMLNDKQYRAKTL